MVIPFPPTKARAWTQAEAETLRGALEALRGRWAPLPVNLTQGAAEDGAAWAAFVVGDEDAPTFTVSCHKAPAGVAVLSEDGSVVSVWGTLSGAVEVGMGVGSIDRP